MISISSSESEDSCVAVKIDLFARGFFLCSRSFLSAAIAFRVGVSVRICVAPFFLLVVVFFLGPALGIGAIASGGT